MIPKIIESDKGFRLVLAHDNGLVETIPLAGLRPFKSKEAVLSFSERNFDDDVLEAITDLFVEINIEDDSIDEAIAKSTEFKLVVNGVVTKQGNKKDIQRERKKIGKAAQVFNSPGSKVGYVLKNGSLVPPTKKEDAPAMNVGGGSIAGAGVGPDGEPGVHPRNQPGGKKKKKKYESPGRRLAGTVGVEETLLNRLKNRRIVEEKFYVEEGKSDHIHTVNLDESGNGVTSKDDSDDSGPHTHKVANKKVLAGGTDGHTHPLGKEMTAKNKADHMKETSETKLDENLNNNESYVPNDTFAGAPVFDVDSDTFAKCRNGRNRYERWKRFVDEDTDVGRAVKKYSQKNPSEGIVLRDKSGAMFYLRTATAEDKKDPNTKFELAFPPRGVRGPKGNALRKLPGVVGG